ncbi:MAG: chaperonin GroEL [Candidatus Desulfatibia sp.]|uniref:chaperonin GroEL n=1 Tax=Candidatus Desulfatibia sp. TaxID=3101189 RepID=UPI002F2C94BD
MPVIIKNRENGLGQILVGMETLANALKITFGPRGRHVMIEKSGDPVKFTRIGAEVADGFRLSGTFQNLGVSLLRGVAESTYRNAGDGSVMSTVMAMKLFKECIRLVQSGHSIVDLGKGLLNGAEKVNESLTAFSKPVKTINQMESLLVTSSGGDSWIVEPILSLHKKLGDKGSVTFGYTDGIENKIIFRKGLSFDETYLSPYFDDPNSESSELDDPFILVCADKITDMEEVLSLTEKISETDRPLLVIAEDINDDALSLFLLNKKSGVLNTICVKAPGFGDKRVDLLEDIAAFTGSKVFGRSLGSPFEKIGPDKLGGAQKVRVERSRTIIMDGKGTKSRLKKRLGELRKRLSEETDDYEKQTMKTRIAKLMAGVATIKIGGYTETEKSLKRSQISHAYSTLLSGMEGGYVPGGGLALMMAASALEKSRPGNNYEPAYKALATSLCAPLVLLAENSNANGDYIKEKVTDGSFKSGFNALTGKLESVASWPVIDPLKTVLVAVDTAVSFAVNLLSSEVFIAEKPYVLAEDEAPLLGLKGHKGMRGIAGMEHDHK